MRRLFVGRTFGYVNRAIFAKSRQSRRLGFVD